MIMYNTTREKAKFLDNLVDSFLAKNEKIIKSHRDIKNSTQSSDEGQIQKSIDDIYVVWNSHCEEKLKYDKDKAISKKLSWLYDRQIMEVLIHDDTIESSFQKALKCKMW